MEEKIECQSALAKKTMITLRGPQYLKPFQQRHDGPEVFPVLSLV